MPTLSTHALAQLQTIRATFGEAAFADFRLYIETSPRYTQQVEAYFDLARNGAVNVDPSIVNGAQYQVDGRDPSIGGMNDQFGLITFSANPNTFQRVSGWSVGYGLAEAFAHELGHAFDPRLGTTAQQNAFEQGGFRQQTLVRTESEAAGQINAYLLMSEARSNLRDAAANPYVNLPFDPDMQVTAFRFAEGAIKGFLQTTAAADFADTCSVNRRIGVRSCITTFLHQKYAILTIK